MKLAATIVDRYGRSTDYTHAHFQYYDMDTAISGDQLTTVKVTLIYSVGALNS